VVLGDDDEPLTDCPDTVYFQFEGCMNEMMISGFDFEVSVEECFDPELVQDTLHFVCAEIVPALEFCADDDFDQSFLVSECLERIDGKFNVIAPFAAFGQGLFDTGLPELIDAFNEDCEGLCELDVSVFNYQANRADFTDFTRASVEVARAEHEFGFEFANGGEVPLSRLGSGFEGHEELLDAITFFGGDGPIHIGVASRDFEIAASVVAVTELLVVTYDNSKIMVVVELTVAFD